MAEQQCENCGKPNQATAAYCYACGHILAAGMQSIKTRGSTRGLPDDDELSPQLRWGTAYFGEDTLLRMRVRDTNEIVAAQFTESCVIGRSASEVTPDVDLKNYQAGKLGVSRQHIRLKRELSTIMVEDLGSRNGTFLNGDKLVPYQPRVLRNGDELRLGHLVLRIAFTRAPADARPANSAPDLPSDAG